MAKHNALSDETKQAIALDYLAGMPQNAIADKHNVNAPTVSKIVSNMKMSEIKEKEPAAAGTATDSKENISHENNNTSKTESQALRGVEVIGLMQTMLIGIEENFGDNVEVMSLKADSDTASIMFRYGGGAYSLSFGTEF